MLDSVGRAAALENRSWESGDQEGRWEWIATACFESLPCDGSGLQNDCSAVCHTALLVEEMAVLHLAHVCGCWTHSA